MIANQIASDISDVDIKTNEMIVDLLNEFTIDKCFSPMFSTIEKYCIEIKMMGDLTYLLKSGLRDIGETWAKGGLRSFMP